MITTFAHGNGPYSRTVDLGLAINNILKEKKEDPLSIIVPLVYGDRQKNIMLEDFGDIIKNNPNLILFDETYGEILNKLFFKTGHYKENLELLLEKQPELEEQLNNHLSGKFKVKNFGGDEIEVYRDDIAFEISHNPRVATHFAKSYYTTIAFFSEILRKAAKESSLIDGPNAFDKKLLLEVAEKIADKIENDKKMHFMPEPFVFSYDSNRKRLRGEIFTPPFIHLQPVNTEDIKEGMYVMVTGIDGLMDLFKGVKDFGQELYCPPFVNIEGVGPENKKHPNFVFNRNIDYQFARTGWSTVWWSLMSKTPLIAPKYTKGDDPEIYFNELSVSQLGLAVIFDSSRIPRETLQDANFLRPNLENVNELLNQNYGKVDGMDYTADIIVRDLMGADISKFRMKEPCLQGYKSIEVLLPD